jgi:hypothetical protein
MVTVPWVFGSKTGGVWQKNTCGYFRETPMGVWKNIDCKGILLSELIRVFDESLRL